MPKKLLFIYIHSLFVSTQNIVNKCTLEQNKKYISLGNGKY